MELRHLRYFVAVANELHFRRAANQLHTSQPSLSQQIRDLERELKVDLFARTGHHVELTGAGRRFLPEAQAILTAAERAAAIAREAGRGETRKLVIGISPETDWRFLGTALRNFIEHQPPVEVAFQNLTPEAQIAALHDGQIDVGFADLPLEADGLVSETTGRVRLVVGLPAKHPLAARKILRLEELSKEAYILWPRHLSPGRYDRLLEVFRRAGFGPPISMEGGLPSTRTVLGMIAAGLTIALVDPTLSQMAFPGVVFREVAGLKAFSETGIIFRRDDSSPLVASFLLEVRRASSALRPPQRLSARSASSPAESEGRPARRRRHGTA